MIIIEKSNYLNDFMQYVYENDNIKEVDDAFNEYPVEEEWHKGSIENILREDVEEYGSYEVGDIVFVEKFNYSNGTQGKRHFFVIIDQNNTAVPIENFGMLVSSKIDKAKYNENVLLKKDNKNKLNKDSIVKTDVIYKILNKQVLFKIGYADNSNIEKYKQSYYNKKQKVSIY